MQDPEFKELTEIQSAFRKPWMGIIWFVIVMVVFIFVGVPIQMYFLKADQGMVGLAVTEVIILILAIVPILLSGRKFRDVFAFKAPALRPFFGALLMWAGAFSIVIFANALIAYLFPQQMSEVSEGIGGFFTNVPFIVAIFVFAVMPAICEEALHRGFIQSTMRSIRFDWVIVLIMGFIFGVFHLDPVRFLGTAILGAVLSYVMVKTRNIFYPSFLHMINNAIPVILMYTLLQPATQDNAVYADQVLTTSGISTSQMIGSMLMLSCLSPILLIGGAMLIKSKAAGETAEAGAAQRRKRIKAIIAAIVLSATLFVAGLVTLVAGVFLSVPVNVNEKIELSQSSDPREYSFVIEAERPYQYTYNIESDKGLVLIEFLDESDVKVLDFYCKQSFGNGILALKPGTYRLIVTLIPADAEAFLEGKGYEYNDDGGSEIVFPSDENEKVGVQITFMCI
ncbi:MAG: CPBP family intramembrane metalloprotease [Clostridiaceae bacterium]|nr:CPBP family intramembrane metalloprotease [Oscillospiraceae bacterium]NLO63046.1 CPBP family intramembrane metalloprotease [Clostridiaceae bacterium]